MQAASADAAHSAVGPRTPNTPRKISDMAILICATPGTQAIPVTCALQTGCIAYLRKPLDTRRLLDLMERLLGGARQ